MLKTPPGPHRGSGEKGVRASLPTASPPTSCPVTCPRLPPRPLRCTSTPLTLAFAQRQASPGGAVGSLQTTTIKQESLHSKSHSLGSPSAWKRRVYGVAHLVCNSIMPKKSPYHN